MKRAKDNYMCKNNNGAIQSRFGTILSIILFFCVGIAAIYIFNVKYVILNYQVRSGWVQVPCELVSLRLETKTVLEEGMNNRPRRYVKKNFIKGEFTYTYNGRQYTSGVVNFQSGFNTTILFRDQLSKYNNMSAPFCYVNPESPQDAVLDPYCSPYSWVMSLLGLVFIGISVLLLLWFRYESHGMRKTEDFDLKTDVQY